MNDNVDKNIEKLIKKTMRSTVLESPSFDFNHKVMSHIMDIPNTALIENKPLIPKVVWVVIAICFLALIAYVFLGTNSTDPGWFSKLDFSIIRNSKIANPLSGINISKIFTYAILLFGVMLCIQISILKNHFNQRFQ